MLPVRLRQDHGHLRIGAADKKVAGRSVLCGLKSDRYYAHCHGIQPGPEIVQNCRILGSHVDTGHKALWPVSGGLRC